MLGPVPDLCLGASADEVQAHRLESSGLHAVPVVADIVRECMQRRLVVEVVR